MGKWVEVKKLKFKKYGEFGERVIKDRIFVGSEREEMVIFMIFRMILNYLSILK